MKTTLLTVLICAIPFLTIAQDSTKFTTTIKGEIWELPFGDGYLKDDNHNKSFGLDFRYFTKDTWAQKIGATHLTKSSSLNQHSLSQDTSYAYWGANKYSRTTKISTLETVLGLEKYFKLKRLSLFAGINVPIKFDLKCEEQRESVGFDQLGRAGSSISTTKSKGGKAIGLGLNTGFNLHFSRHFSFGTEITYNSMIKYFDYADRTYDYSNYDLIAKTTTTGSKTYKGSDSFIPFGSNWFGNLDLRLSLNLNYHF